MQTSDRQVIAAFFDRSNQAEQAIQELHEAGFRAEHLGCSFNGPYSSEYGAGTGREQNVRTGRENSEGLRSFWDKVEAFFKGDEGYENRNTGANDGPLNEGQRIGPTLSIPPQYNDRLSSGGCLVTVHNAARFDEAERILTRNGGQIDRSFGEYAGSDRAEHAGSERSIPNQGQGEPRIQLLSEVLRINKERIQAGEVRVRKEVHTEIQHLDVPVTREEVVIERTPVQGSVAGSGQIGSNEEIRVPLTEERVQVEKTPVVREEVRVGKKAVQGTQNVSESVRREDIEVDSEGRTGTDADKGDPRFRKSA